MQKIALTTWGEQISPLFESAGNLLIVEHQRGQVINEYKHSVARQMPLERICLLVELQVNVFICGAISEIFSNMIKASGIRLIPFVSGNVQEIIHAFLGDNQNITNYRMPGCFGRKRRRKRRGGR